MDSQSGESGRGSAQKHSDEAKNNVLSVKRLRADDAEARAVTPRPRFDARLQQGADALEQFAMTYRFRLGVPKNFKVLMDGKTVLYLQSSDSRSHVLVGPRLARHIQVRFHSYNALFKRSSVFFSPITESLAV